MGSGIIDNLNNKDKQGQKKTETRNKKENDMNRKLMNSGIGLCLACVAALAAASCTDDTDGGATLPAGTYPMTFTAAVDGPVATRATTDNSGKTSWQVDDPVAISMDGGANHKQYKISDTGTGAMLPDGEANTLYWQKSNETKTLAAWYPVSCTIGSNTGSGEVSITGQNASFATLENILHAPAKDYTYSSGNPVAFVFRHALAKVKVTLKKGDGITDSDLSNATVTFTGYTAGSLGYGGMTGSGSNGDITPKTETPVSGGAATYTALVIPQQMQGKKFIKVTIGAGHAARDYYYTPTGSTDADLEAGKQYTYTITVKKTGLQVESVTASWDDSSITPGTPTEATFQVHLPESHGQTLTVDGATQVELSNVYTIDENKNTFSISYAITDDNKAKGFLIAKGIGKGKRTVSGNTCIFTYSNIRSDIWLNYTLYAEVGYYYYNDGTCSSTYSSGSSSACIGIVFKTGAGEGDNISNYTAGTFTDNVIHGYVVALKNIDGDRKSWGNISNVSLHTDNTKFYGYSNTQAIKKADGYNETDFRACYQAVNYAPAAPAGGTSGWYLPSLGEYNALWQVYGEIQSKLTAAGGTDMKINWGFYWTSSKKNSSAACVDFGAWSDIGSFTNAIRTDNAYVRPVLTF